MRKLILFELNEVPWAILDYYCRKYPQSNTAQLLPKCTQYETITEDEGHLSPWITWPTFHRGVSNVQHHIQDFGEDLTEADRHYPPIWKLTQQQGISTGVFASMHSYPPPANYRDYAFYVPDPFAGESTVHPDSLMAFQQFNLTMSRKSGRNVDTGIDWKGAIKLGTTLPKLGIQPSTLAEVGGQLVKERMKPWIRTRRRSYQSILAFDVFMKLMRTTQPAFATYLSNHVASTMHRYWAATFPEHYDDYELSETWKQTYRNEIDFTMHKFDAFLGTLVQFTRKYPEYKLVVASSMGQKATEAKLILTETACKDLAPLMAFLQIPDSAWEMLPAMHPQYNFKVSEAFVTPLVEQLKTLYIDGKPLSFRQKEGGFFSVDFGHRNLKTLEGSYQGLPIDLTQLGIYNEPVEDQTGSTAYHVPEGSLFVYDPQHPAQQAERIMGVSTCAFVPSVLENFGLTAPAYATSERIGAISEALATS